MSSGVDREDTDVTVVQDIVVRPTMLIGEPASDGAPDQRGGVLRDEVAVWQASRDRIRAKVNWQFTTADARVKLLRLYRTLHE